MAKKKTTGTPKSSRIVVNPLLHWATRASNPGAQSTLPIKAKFLKVTASTLEEASKVSLLADLLVGKCSNKGLQDQFDKLAKKQVEDFNKAMPDFSFSVGGRPLGSKVDPKTKKVIKAK